MADTTHNVTIKATLDTSTTGSASGRSGSTSSGGGEGGFRNIAPGIALAGSTFVKTIDVVRHSLSALMVKLVEMGLKIDLLSTMYYKVH